MPAYNAANDIDKAIKSVLEQTFKNFCLIIVNDGSTDNTSEILNKFSNENRIKIISQSNTGIAGAYKKAFEYIDGDYVMFLDSDDALVSNALEEISEIIEQTQSDIVQFGISYFDENWSHKWDLIFPDKEITSNKKIMLDYYQGLNDGSNRPNLGIRAYKANLISNFIFPPIGSLGIDEILNLFAMTQCNKITFISKQFYLCQQRINSVSRIKPSQQKVSGILLSQKEMEKILIPQHSEFMDLLYIKFIKFYISHLNIIKKMPTYKTYQEDFERHISIVKNSSRIQLNMKLKLRISLLVNFPFLSTILSRN